LEQERRTGLPVPDPAEPHPSQPDASAPPARAQESEAKVARSPGRITERLPEHEALEERLAEGRTEPLPRPEPGPTRGALTGGGAAEDEHDRGSLESRGLYVRGTRGGTQLGLSRRPDA